MTKRWRYAATVLALLAFALACLRLLVPEQVLVPADSNCISFFLSQSGECLQWVKVEYSVPGTLLRAAFGALILFGLVYLVYLLVYGLRRVIRGGSPPPTDVVVRTRVLAEAPAAGRSPAPLLRGRAPSGSVCGSCGLPLNPTWTGQCKHCGALYVEYPPVAKAE
jgi:hypothetical protein